MQKQKTLQKTVKESSVNQTTPPPNKSEVEEVSHVLPSSDEQSKHIDSVGDQLANGDTADDKQNLTDIQQQQQQGWQPQPASLENISQSTDLKSNSVNIKLQELINLKPPESTKTGSTGKGAQSIGACNVTSRSKLANTAPIEGSAQTSGHRSKSRLAAKFPPPQ